MTSPQTQTRGKADLHIHSVMSDGLGTIEEIVEHIAHKSDLNVVAITDHDEIRGALQARELAAKRGYTFEIIIGQEVTTRHGHLLVLGVEKPCKMFLSLEQASAWAHENGGVCIAAHPFSYMTLSIGEQKLRQLYAGGGYIDGIETLNPSVAGYVRRDRVIQVNREELHIPEFGNSDSHHTHLIGTAFTTFPGSTAADLMHAIKDNTTQAGGRYLSLREQLQGSGKQTFRSMVVLPSDKLRRAAATWTRRNGT